MTNGKAKIENLGGVWTVTRVRHSRKAGTFATERREFDNINHDLRFCRERGIVVISCEC